MRKSVRTVRALFVAAIVVFTSGVPQVIATALGDECCVDPCDGAFDGKHCPPNCDSGACAKVHASVVTVAVPLPLPLPATEHAVLASSSSPELPLVTTGVFHPPRA